MFQTTELIEELSHSELKNLVHSYCNYVTTYYYDHDKSCEPVCLSEYYYNDYMEKDD